MEIRLLKNKTGILLMSSSISGAEKRLIKLAYVLISKKKEFILILNSKLYDLALKDYELEHMIYEIFDKKRLEILSGDRFKFKIPKVIKNLFQLRKVLIKHDLNILHCSLNGIKYSVIKKIINVKIIAEITSPDVADKLFLKRGYKKQLKYFNLILCVSNSVYLRVLDNSKISKFSMNEFIIDYLKIPFYLPKNQGMDLKLVDKENIIIYASRFIERKNPMLFAEAIKIILENNLKWKAIILGKGPYEKKIKEKLNLLIIKKRVIVKHTHNIYKYLAKSKLYVSLIFPDNYPSQSILEAMYMKNAIVATNVGSTYKFLNNNNGFLIDNYELSSVLSVLNKAIKKSHDLVSMGEKSKELVLKDFSINNYISEYLNIYKKLIE